MRNANFTILVAFILGSSLSGKALAQVAPYLAVGEGQASCGEFIQAMDGERKAKMPGDRLETYRTGAYGKFLNFADGFITGANSAELHWRNLGKGTDHAGRMAWLENYCRGYPLDAYVDGLIALRAFLASKP